MAKLIFTTNGTKIINWKKQSVLPTPGNKIIKRNIGKKFIKHIRNNFPKQGKRHQIFNRNTVKVSYSCTSKMIRIQPKITKLQQSYSNSTYGECSLNSNWLKTSVIYEATLRSKNYIITKENERHLLHKTSFHKKKYANSTSLQKIISPYFYVEKIKVLSYFFFQRSLDF